MSCSGDLSIGFFLSVLPMQVISYSHVDVGSRGEALSQCKKRHRRQKLQFKQENIS